MTATSMDDKKLSCPKCSHAVCFRCREDWHGYCTSCEQAVDRAFEGWGQGADRIVFCPMCRTKIQRSEGCNHMTCLFCKYDFCYHCGGFAGSGSAHFTPGFGCGVTMFGQQGICNGYFLKFLYILGMLVLIPIAIVLGPPIWLTVAMVYGCCRMNPILGCCCCLLFPIPFAIGLCLDICWIPVAIILVPSFFVVIILKNFESKYQNKQEAM